MREETILLTGATGAFGSMLLPRLVARGYRVVCLVRSKAGEHPAYRLPGYDPRQVIAIRGDITADQCGVSAADIELWKGRISFMLHNAASISFTNSEATEATNIEGVSNALELAERLGVPVFRHISTAYVAGDAEVFTEADLLVSQRWRNSYEHSKYIGETHVRAWGHTHPDRRYDIYRPSILIGCEDGTTPTYDAYFGYFRPIDAVANALRNRRKDPPEGIAIADDGSVNLPVVLMASPTTRLNLIPIDWAADMVINLLALPSGNKTYHLVHPRPPLVADVIRWSLAAIGVTGVSIVSTPDEKSRLLQQQSPFTAKLQRTIDRTVDQYLPYTTTDTLFESTVTMLALGKKYRAPASISRMFLRNLLEYAKASEWGTARTAVPAE